MSDPLGLIGTTNALRPAGLPLVHPSDRVGAQQPPGGFSAVLKDQITKVNELQQDARQAVEDLAAGRRTDLESVIIATEKADIAFKMLLQVRNKVMDAYEEVKQIRV
jgi:flagellar hook-basal body complex protein FliE